jgi:hypothetical protein
MPAPATPTEALRTLNTILCTRCDKRHRAGLKVYLCDRCLTIRYQFADMCLDAINAARSPDAQHLKHTLIPRP